MTQERPRKEEAGFFEQRLDLRKLVRDGTRKLFPPNASFLLGEIALYSFVALVLSGVYLAFFYSPSNTPVIYNGREPSLQGRAMPEAFVSVLHLSLDVPFGLVVRQFHHFAAHLFIGSLVLHAARVYFTGAFQRPRELTWWLGLTLLALALLNGFSGYSLPFDLRGGAALRQMLTTLQTVPWVGRWLGALVFGAEFPGPFILRRLYIEHVFIGPALIAVVVATHLYLVARLTHTQYRGPGRSEHVEVGAPAWPDQAARSATLTFLVFGTIALLAAFLPAESLWVYGPYQSLTYYEPLHPDWFLLWIEGAWRLLPRELDFHALGANFTNPFYGAVVFSLLVFGGLALVPLVDARIYGTVHQDHHVLDDWRERPFRTAFGVWGGTLLVMVSIGAVNDRLAQAFGTTIGQMNLVWGIASLVVPALIFMAVYLLLRLRQAPLRSLGDSWRGGRQTTLALLGLLGAMLVPRLWRERRPRGK
jgi:ubiquinol-cytochrome c reductase cytochrome b subunit